MTNRRQNLLDKIGLLLPGYSGYSNREAKRNSDKKLRDNISLVIQNCETIIISHQQYLIFKSNMALCKEWEITRKAINTLFSKVKLTTHGESSFFSENQLKDDELEEIYSFDIEISEKTAIISKTIESEINEPLSASFILKQCRDIDNLLFSRTNYINQYK